MKNYFPHDHYARSDKKLINLTRVLGLGAGWIYWCIVEMLYEENGWLKVADLESIAYDLRYDTQTLNRVINEFDLFFIEDDRFTSKAVLSRLKLIEAKSSAASKAARQRWQKCKDDANAMQTHSDRNALKEIKLNEKKLNESKTEEGNASLSPTLLKDETSEGLKTEKEKPKEKGSGQKEKVGRATWKHLLEMPFPSETFAAKWEEYCSYRETRKPVKIPFGSMQIEQRLLNKLSAFNEPFSISQLDRAMEGNWQGLVFSETMTDYKRFLERQNNGQPNNTFRQNQPSGNKPSGAELAYLIAS